MSPTIHLFNPVVDFCRDCGALLPALSVSCISCSTYLEKIGHWSHLDKDFGTKRQNLGTT